MSIAVVGFTTNPIILERDNVKCNLRTLNGLAKTVSIAVPAEHVAVIHVKQAHVVLLAIKALAQRLPDSVQAFDLGVKEVQLQAWGDSVQKMSSVAFDLAGIDPKRVVVSAPSMHPEDTHHAAA